MAGGHDPHLIGGEPVAEVEGGEDQRPARVLLLGEAEVEAGAPAAQDEIHLPEPRLQPGMRSLPVSNYLACPRSPHYTVPLALSKPDDAMGESE